MITPRYVIDYKEFDKNCNVIMNAFNEMWDGEVIYGYSVKTNHENNLIKYAYDKLKWYVEVVSEYEYKKALEIGVSEDKIIFNGPYKGDLLTRAITSGAYVNLDTVAEVEEICESKLTGNRIGLRVNFDIEKECPMETTAGDMVCRFGICYENGELEKAINLLRENGIPICGLHMHTSSKTRSINIFKTISAKVNELVEKYHLNLEYIDIGGGLFGGIEREDKPTMKEYAQVICTELKKCIHPERTKLILEPGVSVLATCAKYETKVISVKMIRDVRVITVDGTLMHINPFMSNRIHTFNILGKRIREKSDNTQIICGCTCMERDYLAILDKSERIEIGDILSFENVGAYTMAFNSEFIVRPPMVYYV